MVASFSCAVDKAGKRVLFVVALPGHRVHALAVGMRAVPLPLEAVDLEERFDTLD